MTDELRHDPSVQETQIAYCRRQPPRAPRGGRVERALSDRQHPSEPTQDAVRRQTLPRVPTPSSPEGPEPESGPQEEMAASSDHFVRSLLPSFLPVGVSTRIPYTLSEKKTETKRGANCRPVRSYKQTLTRMDVETSP